MISLIGFKLELIFVMPDLLVFGAAQRKTLFLQSSKVFLFCLLPFLVFQDMMLNHLMTQKWTFPVRLGAYLEVSRPMDMDG
jgi:hypothetical protein